MAEKLEYQKEGFVTVNGKDGKIYQHESEGILFRKYRGRGVVRYHRVEVAPGVELLKLPNLQHLLVRHGVAGEGCVYYPLALVLGSESERLRAAAQLGRRPVSERWITRLRYTLGRLCTPSNKEEKSHAVHS